MDGSVAPVMIDGRELRVGVARLAVATEPAKLGRVLGEPAYASAGSSSATSLRFGYAPITVLASCPCGTASASGSTSR